MKWADLIDENIEELAALDAIEAGKLYQIAKAMEIPHAASALRYYAGAADKIHGEVLKVSGEFHAYTLLEPIGVVGHIIPWNAPTSIFYAKAGPSLATGCTIVLKPSEQTSLSALFHAHLAKLVCIYIYTCEQTVQYSLHHVHFINSFKKKNVHFINAKLIYLFIYKKIKFLLF